MIASGTFIEARLDAYAARRMIYESWMMYVTMGLLIYNLTIVMVDRLPWQKKHYPFILVHIGIITMILGGYVTQKWGVDGTVSVPIQGKNNFVSLPQTDLVVYATFDGDRYTKMFEQEVDFFKKPPTPEKTFTVQMGENTVQVWIEDCGKGIDMNNLPRATLERGWTTAGSLGHGFWLMLQTIDHVYLLTGPTGTTVVLEQDKVAPIPAWAMDNSSH